MESNNLMYPPEMYAGQYGGMSFSCGGVPMQSLLAVNSRIEQDRAFITGKTMENLSFLAELEREYAERNPASAGYYSAVMEAYTRAAQETIYGYGREITAGKKRWR